MAHTTTPRFRASEPLGNQGLQEAKIVQPAKRQQLSFEQINEVTVKVTDGRGTNAWDGYRGSYRTTRAIASLMAVGNGQWVVRYRNKASHPMKLIAAKKYAKEMVRGTRPTHPIAWTRLPNSTACTASLSSTAQPPMPPTRRGRYERIHKN